MEHKIEQISLKSNPRYGGKLWGQRDLRSIYKIIVHQELGEANTISVHNYHISPTSHIKKGIGAPRICYHFTIEKNGTIYQTNNLSDIVWHADGQNMHSVGIMLVGDFSGPNHIGKSNPTNEQLNALKWLLEHLMKLLAIDKNDIYGHCDFGKPACPGNDVMKFVKEFKGETII